MVQANFHFCIVLYIFRILILILSRSINPDWAADERLNGIMTFQLEYKKIGDMKKI